MGFTINADKYSFASKPDPEKVSRDYAAEYAKKLVADEEAARKSDVQDLHAELGTESAARIAADNALSSTISAEVSRATAAETSLSDTKVDKADGLGLSKIKNMTMSPQQGGKYLISTERQDSLISNCTVYKSDGIDTLLGGKVDKVDGKVLSTNDYTDDDKAEVAKITTKANKAKLSSDTDYLTLDANAGEYQVYTIKGTYLNAIEPLKNKVDKIDGKGLSANDYTDEDKAEVANVKDKQDKLVFDSHPTLNSTNPVTSHGLFLMWDEFSTKTTLNSGRIGELEDGKSDKATYSMMTTGGAISYDLNDEYNRMTSYIGAVGEITSVSISMPNDAYRNDYISGLSFISGSTPPEVSYPSNPYTMRWIGSECTISGESSVFSPVANKVYDIIFYFNGGYIIGLVVGYDNIA